MRKREHSGIVWIITVLLGITIIFSGCIGGENTNNTGISTLNESFPLNPPGISQTPAPETTLVSGDYDPGLSSLTTPDEKNTEKVNPTFAPQQKTYSFSLEEAPQLTTQFLYVPAYLPQGFTYKGGSIAANGVIWLYISNASTNITYIQAPDWTGTSGALTGIDAQYRTIRADDCMYQCSEADRLHQLFWTDEHHHYYLIGVQSCDELLLMAGSLKILDYDLLDSLPYTVSDPENPFPDPERIRLIFPLAWIKKHYPGSDNSPMVEITLSSEEFNASFSPDPENPSILRHNEVVEDETVEYLSLPRDMFEYFSVGPGIINISYGEEFFIGFTNMESLYECHFSDPYPPGFKTATPFVPGTATLPATPVSQKLT